jgi:hypothetical protein
MPKPIQHTLFGGSIISKDAHFSECRKYRYRLDRHVEGVEGNKMCLFVMLNPSTADEVENDATIRRCIDFCRRWGYAQLRVVNLFAYCSTDPSVLKTVDDPIGWENDGIIRTSSKIASLTVVAWGAHGGLKNRAEKVFPLLEKPMCLGTTKEGYPKHPVRLAANTELVPYCLPT